MALVDKRMIEHEIPLRAVNEASSREKKHPRRYVELVHYWPARRPRSASRVAVAAALLRVPADSPALQERLTLLAALAPYECGKKALDQARSQILGESGGRPPKVLDLFAGGGAIPLEAANLGCEAHAVELNPVAHLIELATCVYPQKYGDRLAELVERWGQAILREVGEKLEDLYAPVVLKGRKQTERLAFAHGEGHEPGDVLFEPIAYLWTRTVPCVNDDCKAAVPLVRQTWLCRKEDRAIALRMVPDKKQRRVRFEIVSGPNPGALGFDPAAFSERGDAECPLCGAAVGADRVKEYGKDGRIGQQLMAVVGLVEGERGRVYLPAEAVRIPTEEELRERLNAIGEDWPGPAGLAMPTKDTLNFKLPLYGIRTFAEMFTTRQAVVLLALSRAIRDTYPKIMAEARDSELATAVVTYLALALDKFADNSCSFATWEASDQIVKHALTQQAIKMIWDFAEVMPFAHVSGSFKLMVAAEATAIRGLADVPRAGACVRASATDLPFADASFDAVVTDPPYSDNISYADLSDFFFVWLKRAVGAVHQAHLSADETPKRQEATVVPYRHGGDEGLARQHYEDLMTASLREAGRVLKPGGPIVIVYAHKTVAGWAALVEAVRSARCAVTESWPVKTESDARLNARDTAALKTSIFLAARKRTSDETCDDYDEVLLPAVRATIDERVGTLWAAGLAGADLVIAVIGAALGPFTRFTRVRRSNGAEVTTAEFLDEAQRLALDAILKQAVRDAAGRDVSVASIDAISRLYVVARMQIADGAAEYDTFKNLAIGALPPGTELDGMRGALMQGRHALLARRGSKVSLRSFEDRGGEAGLGLPDDGRVPSLIDVLHRILWLQRHAPGDVAEFLRRCSTDLESVRLLAQALGGKPLRGEPRPGAQRDERTEEQRAIDTFLASFQDVTRAASAGPLYDSKGGS